MSRDGVLDHAGYFPRLAQGLPHRTILRLDPSQAYRGQVARWTGISTMVTNAQKPEWRLRNDGSRSRSGSDSHFGSAVFLVDAFSGREVTYAQFHEQACCRCCLSPQPAAFAEGPSCHPGAELHGARRPVFWLSVSRSDDRSRQSEFKPRLKRNISSSTPSPKCTVASSSAIQKLGNVLPNPVALSTSQEPIASLVDNAIDHSLVIDRLEDSSSFDPMREGTDDDLALIVYTSGTTAKPKGLAHHIGRMVRNATAFADTQRIDSGSRFYLNSQHGLHGRHLQLLLLPFSHRGQRRCRSRLRRALKFHLLGESRKIPRSTRCGSRPLYSPSSSKWIAATRAKTTAVPPSGRPSSVSPRCPPK